MSNILLMVASLLLAATTHLTTATPISVNIDPQPTTSPSHLNTRSSTQPFIVAYLQHTYGYGDGTNESSSGWIGYSPPPNTLSPSPVFCGANDVTDTDYISLAFHGNTPDTASLAALNSLPDPTVVLSLGSLLSGSTSSNCTYTGGYFGSWMVVEQDVGGMVTCASGVVVTCEVIAPSPAMLEADCMLGGKWSESYFYWPKISCAVPCVDEGC